MKKPITVKILVAVNDMAQFDACTLCFETLRVGWPTADIWVYVNGGAHYGDIASKLHRVQLRRSWPMTSPFVHIIDRKLIHHPDWIQEQVHQNYEGPLVLADPDIVYWKSCEDWEFSDDVLLAGHYNPRMWNDFAKCISVPRIHTHMTVFPDTARLRAAVRAAYPFAFEQLGEFCTYNPFKGRIMFDKGEPVFWDNCSNLYQMLAYEKGKPSERRICHFGEEHKQCYDHLNSASYYDLILGRIEESTKPGFVYAHKEWVKNPRPGLWPLVEEYYKQKAIEGWVKHPTEETLKV